MRIAIFALIGAVGLAILPVTASAFPPGPGRAEPGAARYLVEAAQGCSPGFHWVGKHRNRYGAWVPGHCARN